jgi:hypothetical protein
MEEVLIPYIQAYGGAEAVKQILQWMDSQEFTYQDLIERNERQKDSGI